jgi:predicted ferric reductase
VVLAAAGVVWWIDRVLNNRIANGTDNATRLAAILTYVGVNGPDTLARALGFTALITAYVTVVAGLLPIRSPALSTLHRQTGAVTVALVAAHASVPFTAVYVPYGGWTTSFVPFAQPVSWGIHAATWESFGILAFYLLVLTGPTYWLVRRRRAWGLLHRVTIAVYGLSVAHAFLLGSDFLVHGPARVVLLAAQAPVLALAAWRLLRAREGRRGWRRPASAAVGAGSALAAAAVAVMAVLVATGGYAPGMRL